MGRVLVEAAEAFAVSRQTVHSWLAREQVEPLPSRSGGYRAAVRHGLIEPKAKRKRLADCRRWERAGPWSRGRWGVVPIREFLGVGDTMHIALHPSSSGAANACRTPMRSARPLPC